MNYKLKLLRSVLISWFSVTVVFSSVAQSYEVLGQPKPDLKHSVDVLYGLNATYTTISGPKIRLRNETADLVGTTVIGLRYSQLMTNRLWASVGYYSLSYEIDYLDAYGSGAVAFTVGGNSSARVPVTVQYELLRIANKRKSRWLSLYGESGINIEFAHGKSVQTMVAPQVSKNVSFTNGLHILPELALRLQFRATRRVGLNVRYGWIFGFSDIQRETLLDNEQIVGVARINGTGASALAGLQVYF